MDRIKLSDTLGEIRDDLYALSRILDFVQGATVARDLANEIHLKTDELCADVNQEKAA